ncbi:hypothetical protein [Stenomitos frigidus]|uniref:Uncharacterized protein n=1 Tax=Stenomitos frigidus ULC18 TaxID=2107698 RepID=A0A2T1EH17_9CYAN|nr:hypothetical protein [Stenomitos frigidus]PSB32060.1 hypothetical protein C7B82_06190 [Stenomitos frigidus ULC18]
MLLALKQLLSSIVDYAGLFPPAQLSLPEAMTMYDRAQASPERWLVGRFVLPAACLPTFVTILPTVLEPGHSSQWSLSVILSQNWAAELKQIHQHVVTDQLLISALEVPPLLPSDMQQVCLHLPVGVTAFFEIPWSAALEPYLTLLQQPCVAAKLRTGGVTSDAFPDSAQLAQRLLSLAKAEIPFKATAGLHHSLRGKHRLTYKPDSASTTMHGFLNVSILAAFGYQQSVTLDDAIALLEEQSMRSFQCTETTICWRDYALSLLELERFRQQFFHSFGSCSIQEPIDDLRSLRLL